MRQNKYQDGMVLINVLHRTYSPSRKNSFSVLENRLENLTKSRFRCSSCCFPSEPGINPVTSFTASNSFLIALAISLRNKERCLVSFLIYCWLQQLIHRTLNNLLNRFKKRLTVSDFIWNSTKYLFQSS